MKQNVQRRGAVAGVAAVGALALAIGGSVPAIAADYQLGEEDILAYEIGDEASDAWNYNEWHISQTYHADAQLDEYVTFNECSISFNGDPRGAAHHIPVLKGFDLDARPLAALPEYGGDGTFAEFQALIDSIEIEVISGSVTLQLPVFMFDGWNSEPRPVYGFTTVRSVGLGEGVHRFADLELTDSSDWLGDVTTWAAFYGEFQEDIDDEYFFEILAVGFTGSEGAEVASISFAGDTYYFGTGDCTPVDDVEEDDDVEDEEEVEDDTDAGEEIIAPTPPASVETDA